TRVTIAIGTRQIAAAIRIRSSKASSAWVSRIRDRSSAARRSVSSVGRVGDVGSVGNAGSPDMGQTVAGQPPLSPRAANHSIHSPTQATGMEQAATMPGDKALRFEALL